MTHSMGCRILMGTCWHFHEAFAPRAGSVGGRDADASLLQVTSRGAIFVCSWCVKCPTMLNEIANLTTHTVVAQYAAGR